MTIRITMVNDNTKANKHAINNSNSNVNHDSEADIPLT